MMLSTEVRKKIGDTPALLSILYDVDLLPEQIVSERAAFLATAIVAAYEAGVGFGKENANAEADAN